MDIGLVTFDHLKSILEKKQYKFFDDGKTPYNVNLIGIRGKSKKANHFDDLITISFRDFDGSPHTKVYSSTTDPGTYWLKNPMAKDGTAVLLEGQYPGMWMIGEHRGKYPALVQKSNARICRDNNLDNIIDINDAKILNGIFGINLHCSNPYRTTYYVDRWSAGCQVIRDRNAFKILMNIVKISEQYFPNSFTYTLINEMDLQQNIVA